MASSHTLIRLISPIPWGLEIPLVIAVAVITNLIWILLVRIQLPYAKILPITWLSLQAATALFYTGYIMSFDPSYFFQVLSKPTQILLTGLINLTLTFPFGQYIDQLDGVYWTLAVELLFYTLYPIIFIPIYQLLSQTRSIYRILFLASLPPFFFVLQTIFSRVLWLHMYSPHLFIYFTVGMLIGFHLKNLTSLLNRFPVWVAHTVWIIPMLYSIFATSWVPQAYFAWVQILTVVPVGMLTLTAIIGKPFWSSLLDNPVLTTLGKYSYSLYLTHALAIHLATRIITPNSTTSNLIVLTISFIIALTLSKILFHFTELPYFNSTSRHQHSQTVIQPTTSTSAISFRPHVAFAFIVTIIIIAVTAFKVPASLTSFAIPNQARQTNLIITSQPQQIPFTAQSDYLGMITSHINVQSTPNPHGSAADARLYIRLYQNQQLIKENSYKLSELTGSRHHPFGFPIQANSANQTYAIEYQVLPSDPSRLVTLDAKEQTFNTIYYPPKNQLTKPKQLLTWSLYKITEPFKNPTFRASLYLLAPTLILISYLILNHQIRISKHHLRA